MSSVLLKLVAVSCTFFVTPLALAQVVPPDLLLKSVTAEVSALVKRSRGHLNAARTNEVNDLVERKIVPLFDFGRMTQNALARNWAHATVDQRSALTAEFKTLLVRTYSTVLRNYRDQVIEFKSVSVEPASTHVTVSSVMKQAGSAGTLIDYEMEKTAAGWKVYEIRFDGVKLIENYRSTFAARVRDVGIDGLIKALSDKNRQSNNSGADAEPVSPPNRG